MSTLLLNNLDLDNDLEDHFKFLGVGCISAYKLWCYRHGLSTELHKDTDQRRDKVVVFKSGIEYRKEDVNKRHSPRRAEWIARIFLGELQNEKLSDVLHRIRALYNNLVCYPGAQQALGRMLLHVEKYGDLMRPARASGCFGDHVNNTHLSGLEQIARHYKDWIHPVEDWRTENYKPRLQFRSLARHLLAKYNVPSCFDTAFLQGNTPEAHREQEWFKHIGMGQNIRTSDIPMRITKRMAHLLHGGHHFTICQAMRNVQYQAFGGSRQSSWEIASGPLGEGLENESFWETVVQFLANHPILDRSYINPIIDYIRNQKFTPQRILQDDGTEIEGPPPHSNFCMKGRSINKLIQQVDNWHEELTGLEDVPLEKWRSSGFREFEHVGFDPEMKRNLQWTINELTTSAQMYVEGRIMHHCAGSYVKNCASGEKSVWSLRALDLDAAEENQEQAHVLTIAIENKRKTVSQYAGKYNLKPFSKKHIAKERKAGNVYLHLLRRSPTFMRMWMDREGLSYA